MIARTGPDLLTNLYQGLRLVILRPDDPKAFRASLDQIAILLIFSAAVHIGLEFLATPPQQGFRPQALSSLAGRYLFFLAAGFAVVRLVSNAAQATGFIVALASVQPFVAAYTVFSAWALKSDALATPDRLRWALGALGVVWMLLIVSRLVRAFFETRAVRGLSCAAIYCLIFATTAAILPPAPLWYTQRSPAVGSAAMRINAEDTFYAQPALLDARLRNVASQRPGVTDLYFLGFASYGHQDIFMREVQDFRTLFDQRFGTRGRSINLINNPRTLQRNPIASVTNLGHVLEALAQRMDAEEDILFLYLTSHGTETRDLSVRLQPLRLNRLQPEDLRRLLDRAGIKWRIIVVQACFSGEFIDALRDEHSLVITASRRDRASFGCNDTRTHSYFGEAFFDRQLRERRSFLEAFDGAKALVTEWEREGGYPPSEPQVAIGAGIATKLKRFEAELLASRPVDRR